MSELIDWCALAGAWLLVAGPIHQAAIELDDETYQREAMEHALGNSPAPPPVSAWWLLIPPVAYALNLARHRARRRALISVLTRDQLAQLMHFKETATAWMFVASGAFLIAIKQTWDVHDTHRWSTAALIAVLAALTVVCIANTILRVRRRQSILDQSRPSTSATHPG